MAASSSDPDLQYPKYHLCQNGKSSETVPPEEAIDHHLIGIEVGLEPVREPPVGLRYPSRVIELRLEQHAASQ